MRNSLGLFSSVWVRAHFPLKIPFIDTNHYLIHLQKYQQHGLLKIKKYHLQTILCFIIIHQLDRQYEPKREEDPKLIPQGFLCVNVFYRKEEKFSCFSSYQNVIFSFICLKLLIHLTKSPQKIVINYFIFWSKNRFNNC